MANGSIFQKVAIFTNVSLYSPVCVGVSFFTQFEHPSKSESLQNPDIQQVHTWRCLGNMVV
jgi:hypothetical protein